MSSIQTLPEEIRIVLFENYITDAKDNLTLRQVCHQFKAEIDQTVGIRQQVTFIGKMDDHFLQEFLESVALRSILINGSLCPLKLFLRSKTLIRSPLKLESLKITGGFWYHCLRKSLLCKCSNLRKLELQCMLFKGDEEENFIKYSSLTFPLLQDLSIITEPYPPLPSELGEESKTLFQIHARIPFFLIHAITAPKLHNFTMKVKYTVMQGVKILDIVGTSVVSFLRRHSESLKTVHIAIQKTDRGMSFSHRNDLLKLTNSSNATDIPEDFFEEEEFSYDKTKTMKSLTSFKFQIDGMTGHEEILEFLNPRTTSLKDLGLKMKSRLNFNLQILPAIERNVKTLSKLFLSFENETRKEELGDFQNSVNFGLFQQCSNLELLSLHVEVLSTSTQTDRTWLKNIAFGIRQLDKLKVLVIDGFIIGASDFEEAAAYLRGQASNILHGGCRLEALGIVKTSCAPTNFSNGAWADGGDEEPSGINFQCFANLITNRSLEALLLDMDCVYVTTFSDGKAIEDLRTVITGQFRSLMLDISYKDCMDMSTNPYWKSTFLGFNVDFPLL